MSEPALKEGQVVWIHNGGKGNPLIRGTVIKEIQLPRYSCMHYIIEIPTEVEPILEIRSYDTVSLKPDGPLNMWVRLRKTRDRIVKNVRYTI